MTPEKLEQLITADLDVTSIATSGAGGKFEVEVCSAAFADLSTLKRHQMVYKIVNEYISSGELHALSIKAHTPEELQNL